MLQKLQHILPRSWLKKLKESLMRKFRFSIVSFPRKLKTCLRRMRSWWGLRTNTKWTQNSSIFAILQSSKAVESMIWGPKQNPLMKTSPMTPSYAVSEASSGSTRPILSGRCSSIQLKIRSRIIFCWGSCSCLLLRVWRMGLSSMKFMLKGLS